MADYKHRGEKPDGFVFWTKQALGHQINGVYAPSLNVFSSNSMLDAAIDFSYVGDSGDENPLGLSVKDLFLDFITHPKVRDTALELIRDKVGTLAVIQIMNFIEREKNSPRSSRPPQANTGMDVLRAIAKNSALKS